jgi:hypothetical protein
MLSLVTIEFRLNSRPGGLNNRHAAACSQYAQRVGKLNRETGRRQLTPAVIGTWDSLGRHRAWLSADCGRRMIGCIYLYPVFAMMQFKMPEELSRMPDT